MTSAQFSDTDVSISTISEIKPKRQVMLEERNLQCGENKTRRKTDGTDVKDLQLLTPIYHINRNVSFARNRQFLKDLEITKARLRTYAAYTPTDREVRLLEAEYLKYLRKHLS